jgi:hypothetical protein
VYPVGGTVGSKWVWRDPGLHVAIWGNVEADKKLDLTLAIPADTLAHLGLKRVPPKAVLPLRVSGTISNPSVDWIRSVSPLPYRRRFSGLRFGTLERSLWLIGRFLPPVGPLVQNALEQV